MDKKRESDLKKATIFKNTVGRPTNEIKEKRRLFYSLLIIVCLSLIAGASYFFNYIISNADISHGAIKKAAASAGDNPKLYCVSDSDKSVSITEIGVDTPLRCYTDNKAGIKLSASKDGLYPDYESSFTTVKGDYWIKLRYSTPGTKTIKAKDGKDENTYEIKVVEPVTPEKAEQNKPSLYCVKDSIPSEIITDVKANEPFRCYTDKKAGIKLTASEQGFDFGNNRTITYTTVKNDYWIRLMYTTEGIKTIIANDGGETESIDINVIGTANTLTTKKAGPANTTTTKKAGVTNTTTTKKAGKNNTTTVKGSNNTTITTPQESDDITLYCDSEEFYAKEEFRCYTDNRAGITLSAEEDGLVSGYDSEYITEEDDYWIRLKYTKAGVKTITATDGSESKEIYVTIAEKTTTKNSGSTQTKKATSAQARPLELYAVKNKGDSKPSNQKEFTIDSGKNFYVFAAGPVDATVSKTACSGDFDGYVGIYNVFKLNCNRNATIKLLDEKNNKSVSLNIKVKEPTGDSVVTGTGRTLMTECKENGGTYANGKCTITRNTTTTKATTLKTPSIHCNNPGDSASKVVKTFKVNKEIKCYTDKMAGIKLTAEKSGFVVNGGKAKRYTSEFTTTNSVNWFTIKYSNTGTKTIRASYKGKTGVNNIKITK